MFFKRAVKGNLTVWQPSILAGIYVGEKKSPLCPVLCNHCYPCKSNCKWMSLLNLYIDDLSLRTAQLGTVWSIENLPHFRFLWLPLGVLYRTASEMKKRLVFHESSCSTCCAPHLICSHYPHPSLALLFPSPLSVWGLFTQLTFSVSPL